MGDRWYWWGRALEAKRLRQLQLPFANLPDSAQGEREASTGKAQPACWSLDTQGCKLVAGWQDWRAVEVSALVGSFCSWGKSRDQKAEVVEALSLRTRGVEASKVKAAKLREKAQASYDLCDTSVYRDTQEFKVDAQAQHHCWSLERENSIEGCARSWWTMQRWYGKASLWQFEVTCTLSIRVRY